ncbi:DNA-binding response regulator, OmpR family, contains REC and winged-helix (wHTH) domain [Caldanaerobius fijiensis DSM 17918]|uniref:Stage 0 sporulation protein A homolog n=1 Tax=Caldanaerobius fijiensis DSM 17918 TaxID=1121256 RepID=A0A1M5DI46_9THEO|nr:response regulator transcription factor [Caldanaerobius fijiensis]SHF66673.1 DNA-binding response regulator, OmpR family, contains REC and winged-helix (wHTH) domain [Caldanaerobius fijiensis DSM 17918]
MANNVVLIADDDKNVQEILQLYLKKEGFDVEFADDGDMALKKARDLKPDLIILDIMMPVLDGLEVCKQLRKESDVPIIMLTAKGEDLDKILGLEIGADDYVTKPFNPREVVARVKAVIRRVAERGEKGGHNKKNVIAYPGLEIDIDNYYVKLNGQEVAMTPKEIELLWYLASNCNKVFTREQLLEEIWGYDYYGDTRTVDTHIKRIRAKLNKKDNYPWDIKTVWGVGYKFEVNT